MVRAANAEACSYRVCPLIASTPCRPGSHHHTFLRGIVILCTGSNVLARVVAAAGVSPSPP